MKRITKTIFCITAIIIISILFCLPAYGETAVIKEPIVTEYNKESSDDIIYNALSQYLNNEKIIAGIMGYFKRESKMRSDGIAGWPTRDKQGEIDSSKDFTAKIDEGLKDGSTKDYFIEWVHYHYGGYGLGQWMSLGYLNDFYDFAQKWGTSIGDAGMQCAFMAYSIENQTPKLWEQIKDEQDLWIIGRKIGRLYDGTNELGAETIASFAQEYYKKYAID